MEAFFGSMESVERVYWYLAIGISVVFVIQTIMTFVGADADTGADADFDSNLDDVGQPFQLFSLRNLINFILGFSWTGALLYNVIENKILLAVAAVAVGLLLVGLFLLIMKSVLKLAEDNSFKAEDSVGQIGQVYTTIPSKMGGRGKVSISVNGSLRELEAMTRHEEPITPRTSIRVVSVEKNLLIVELMK